MTYTVLVDDNARYMDESSRYKLGEFATYEEALAAARKVIDDWLQKNNAPGKTGKQLYDEYCMFGEDPFILSPGAERVTFSGREYARQRTDTP